MPEDFREIADRLFSDYLPPVVPAAAAGRSPVHVVYGGANLFKRDTAPKFGRLAIRSIETYAPDFADFARAMWLKGADSLPRFPDAVAALGERMASDPAALRTENPDAWFALTVYERVLGKLRAEPVEDFRIDFEDGYGIRPDDEEDSDAVRAAEELAAAFKEGLAPRFFGFRPKSLQAETRRRSVRTLEIFSSAFFAACGDHRPERLIVTLPKITSPVEVSVLAELLDILENRLRLPAGTFRIEVMIETPESVLRPRETADAGRGRVEAAHFGAFDYTASLGVTADHQHLQHDACRFARQMMQAALASSGVRLSDSVTTEMPVPIHRADNLSIAEIAENHAAVHRAWRRHFNNVTHSLVNGFFQSWDLHPAQLAARYAAVYAFFLESADAQGSRLRAFIDKATRAMLTGNLFDDAASAQGLLNFFVRARSCGALSDGEIEAKTGLTVDEIANGSFAAMIERRSGP